jgi:desmoglein 2
MGGAAGGNTGTGTVEIKVLDINDNIPTLEKGQVKDTASVSTFPELVLHAVFSMLCFTCCVLHASGSQSGNDINDE